MRPPNEPMQTIAWNAICETFAPFEGTCLCAIRADAFFHMALRNSAALKFAAKNRLYMPLVWSRAARAQRILDSGCEGDSRYLFVCDYTAEPGFGTLRPVLQRLGRESLFLAVDRVMRTRGPELKQLNAGLINLDAEAFARSSGRLRQLWRRAKGDFRRLLENCSQQHRNLFLASRSVLQTLLVRAYLYRQIYEEIFSANQSLQAVITHNDFTTCSYLACIVAREANMKSFTLQHGFPTQEYFPTSANHYLVWGERFLHVMRSQPGLRSNLLVTGAPRFDALARARKSRSAIRVKREANGMDQGGRCDVVFLSQSHSPLFSEAEHRLVLATLKPLLEDHRFHLVVRLHPQESEKHFRQLSGFEHVTIAPPDLSLQETLSAADVALSCNSTAMLEAMAIEVPVVQIAPERLRNRLGMVECCGVAENGSELMQCLRSLLSTGQRHAFVEKQNRLLHQYLCHFPTALDAVCQVIEEELACDVDVMEAQA